MNTLVTVVVVDDHPFFRDGVTRGLSASGRVTVAGEAGDGRAALELIRDTTPDVAVVGDRFVVGPLLPIVTGDSHFLVLTLSQRCVRLLEGGRQRVEVADEQAVERSRDDVDRVVVVAPHEGAEAGRRLGCCVSASMAMTCRATSARRLSRAGLPRSSAR